MRHLQRADKLLASPDHSEPVTLRAWQAPQGPDAGASAPEDPVSVISNTGRCHRPPGPAVRAAVTEKGTENHLRLLLLLGPETARGHQLGDGPSLPGCQPHLAPHMGVSVRSGTSRQQKCRDGLPSTVYRLLGEPRRTSLHHVNTRHGWPAVPGLWGLRGRQT